LAIDDLAITTSENFGGDLLGAHQFQSIQNHNNRPCFVPAPWGIKLIPVSRERWILYAGPIQDGVGDQPKSALLVLAAEEKRKFLQ
jgi:hypothetical protein